MRTIARIFALALGLVGHAAPALAQTTCGLTPALPDTERRTEYSISASTGPLNVGFQLYGNGTDYGNWLSVWVNGVPKTAVTDYTVTSPSGPLANLCRPITDAQVTFVAAQTGTIEIVGARRPRRASQVSENRGVTARDFNQIISDMEAQLRESWDFTPRTIRTPPGEVLTVLPPAATRANGFLKFDSTGLIPQIIAGGAGSGTVQGPLTTTVGDMAIWNINNGTLLADAPLNWAPLGGASGNGSFNFTSPGGMALTSTDTTTLGNSVQLGGTLRNGDTIALTLNYNNAAGTARSVTISYGPITGADTLTTIAAGLATALQTAGLSAPLSTDFAPFRFFIPGTVGNVGSLFKFNFAWLTGNNGTPTLQVVNASTAATPTTISMNGTTLAVGAGVTNAIATWDQVNGISALRNYTGGRGGLANDALFYLIVGSNSSNPATQLQYANIGFAIGDPAPATPYGVIQLATGNSWSGQANVWIGKGVYISNFGNNLTPTYPGAVANNRTAAADPGTGSLSMQGWAIPGNAITGTWPANTAYAFWGNSNLTHTDVTKFAIAQDTGTNTLINGTTLGLRTANVQRAQVFAPSALTGLAALTGTMQIGSLCVGDWPAGTGNAFAGTCALDQTVAGNYGYLQTSAGSSIINSASAQETLIRNNNANKWHFASTGGLYSDGVTGTDKGAATLNLGGPIYIGGTQISCANLLDCTTGTWTPTIVSSGGGVPTYSATRNGFYQKIGNLVSVQGTVAITALNTLAAGNLTISGLPFTAANTAGQFPGCSFNSYSVSALAAGNAGLVGFVSPNTQVITPNASGNTGTTQLTQAQFGATGSMFFWCLYSTT